ncbi:MAG: sel1 repeat family protein [Gammaproteobacteria bacterium]|nr:sel1 repeat family protein [Gammaproteobacteria bacterium]
MATIDTGCAPRRRQHHSRTIGRALVGLWLGLLLSTPCLADPQADFERGRQAFARDDLMGAIDWLRRAARAEHTPAQTLLAYILDRAEQNEEALRLFQAAAEKGDTEAMYGLAAMYAAGEGTDKDEASALKWYRAAADLGHERANLGLAEAYLKGSLGLPRDEAAARDLLERGAARGHTPAAERLARLNSSRQPEAERPATNARDRQSRSTTQ